MTRIALPAPVLLLPPLLMRAFESFSFVRARPALRGPAQIVSVTASLLVALPLAIGVFPQDSGTALLITLLTQPSMTIVPINRHGFHTKQNTFLVDHE